MSVDSVTVWEWVADDGMQVPHAVASFCEVYTSDCHGKAEHFAEWWESETGRATWLVIRRAH